MRKIGILALTAVMIVPSVALAKHNGGNDPAGQHRNDAYGAAHKAAVKACKAERSADPAAFKAKYANSKGKKAFHRCVRQHVNNALSTCSAERSADPEAFKTKYANAKGRHAFRRCARQHGSDPVS